MIKGIKRLSQQSKDMMFEIKIEDINFKRNQKLMSSDQHMQLMIIRGDLVDYFPEEKIISDVTTLKQGYENLKIDFN